MARPTLPLRYAATVARQAAATTTRAASTVTAGKPKRMSPSDRQRPPWKTFLFDLYRKMLSPQTSPVSIFFRHHDLDVTEWTTLRSSLPPQPSARLTVLRAGLLPPAIAVTPGLEPFPADKGALAVITFPELNPPVIKATLAALSKASSTPNPRTPAPAIPVKAAKVERLPITFGYINGVLYSPAEIRSFSELPSLDQLRAQLVATIAHPAGTIARLLERRGFEVAQTIEGRRIQLEKETTGESSSSLSS
jgi:ribosomal protein L10